MTQTGFAGDVRRQAVGCRRARTLENWLVGHCQPVETSGQDIELHPAVVDLQSLIATDRVVGIYVSRMIAQVPETRSYSKEPRRAVHQGGRIDVWVGHPKGTRLGVRSATATLPTYDHTDEREWRHLDTCQFFTYVHARPPRVDCPAHGVHQVRLPWAEPMSSFHHAVRATGHRRAQRVRRIGCLPPAALQLGRGLAPDAASSHPGAAATPDPAPAIIGVDEKSAGRGQDDITVVSDVSTGTVCHIADERESQPDQLFRQAHR